MCMKLGYIGLGKMGSAMVLRLMETGHEVVVYDADHAAVSRVVQYGAQGEGTLHDLIAALSPMCTIWIMVPHTVVEGVLVDLLPMLAAGDTVIDGGNSYYRDSIRRHEMFSQKGIAYIDVGVSGGPNGARNGACLMIGGEKKHFENCEQIFQSISLPKGYRHVGRAGAGHFVKMIHNGIEYGMMQAIGEGFAIMQKAPLDLQLGEIADLYTHGSVISSRLVEWLSAAYKEFGDELQRETCCNGSVAHSGEGEWTVKTAEELSVPVPVIKASFDFRVASQANPSYNGQVVSALRFMFGGHDAKPK